ncbi:MAG TPA: succinate dehydrogenase hydrophobic membrane anchor subunit [Demequinaceae bacterium]
MSAPAVVPPRFRRPPRSRTHAEKWSWLFMRVSGSLLIVLIFTHLFVNLMTGNGISAIDFGFVAGKWANPLWQWWDAAMLVLAMIHGTNGMRLLVNDYARARWVRRTLKSALGAAFALVVVLGSLVIFTFDPCPKGAVAADLNAEVCASILGTSTTTEAP